MLSNRQLVLIFVSSSIALSFVALVCGYTLGAYQANHVPPTFEDAHTIEGRNITITSFNEDVATISYSDHTGTFRIGDIMLESQNAPMDPELGCGGIAKPDSNAKGGIQCFGMLTSKWLQHDFQGSLRGFVRQIIYTSDFYNLKNGEVILKLQVNP